MNINKIAFGYGHIIANSPTGYEDRFLTDKEQLEYLEKIINNAPEDKFEFKATKKFNIIFPEFENKIVEHTGSFSLANGDSVNINRISDKTEKRYLLALKTKKELEGTRTHSSLYIFDEGNKNPKLAEMFDKLVKTFIKQP